MVDGLRRLRREEKRAEEKRQVENISTAPSQCGGDVLGESIYIYQKERQRVEAIDRAGGESGGEEYVCVFSKSGDCLPSYYR